MDACIISKDGELTSEIQQTLRDSGIHCPDVNLYHESEVLDKAFDGLNANTFCFVAASSYHPELLDILRKLRADRSSKSIVVLPVTSSSNTLEIFRASASEILTLGKSFNAELLTFLQRFRTGLLSDTTQLTAVLPTSSRSDATLLAVNLSAVMTRLYGRCNLLELSAPSPTATTSAAEMLGMSPRQTFDHILSDSEDPSEAQIERTFEKHNSGIRLLSGSSTLGEPETIPWQRIGDVIDCAKRTSPQTIATCSDASCFAKAKRFRACNNIILTTRLDTESLIATRQSLDFLRQDKDASTGIAVVALCSGGVQNALIAKARKALDLSDLFCVSHVPVLTRQSVEAGVPVVIEHPQCDASRGILQLALTMTCSSQTKAIGESEQQAFGTRVFGMLRGLFGNSTSQFAPKPNGQSPNAPTQCT